MTFSKLVWIKAITRSHMHHTTKIVGIALCNYARADGTNAHPGVNNLAAELRMSEKTVRRQLEIIRAEGWGVRTYKASYAGKREYADVYQMTTPSTTGHPCPVVPDQTTGHLDTTTGHLGTDHRTPMSDHQILSHQILNHTVSPSNRRFEADPSFTLKSEIRGRPLPSTEPAPNPGGLSTAARTTIIDHIVTYAEAKTTRSATKTDDHSEAEAAAWEDLKTIIEEHLGTAAGEVIADGYWEFPRYCTDRYKAGAQLNTFINYVTQEYGSISQDGELSS